jgi:adenylosuccinate lyase
MEANLESTGGLVFSQRVLLSLVESGLSRDDAYRIVQRNAMQAWEQGARFRDLLDQDPDVHLSATTLDHIFDTSAFLRNAEAVFARLARVEL